MRGLTTTQIVLIEPDYIRVKEDPQDFPETYFLLEIPCLLNSRISFTLFRMNVPHCMLHLIHANTVVESDQNIVPDLFRVKNLITEIVSLTVIVAAINSKRGIVALSGALALKSITFTAFSYSILAKTAAA